MNIHQVNISYSAEHDRLLIRINSLAGEEFRAWLTRRLALKLMPHLDKTARQQVREQLAPPPAEAPLDQQRQQMVQNFEKEAAAYQGDFQTPYKDKPATLPLGEEPLLVTEISFTPLADAKLQVMLLERLGGRQRDLQLVMDPPLTQGLLRLLNQGLKASGWTDPLPALGPALPAIGGAAEAGAAGPDESHELTVGDKPRYLN